MITRILIDGVWKRLQTIVYKTHKVERILPLTSDVPEEVRTIDISKPAEGEPYNHMVNQEHAQYQYHFQNITGL